MIIRPGVEFKTVEGDALYTDWDFCEEGPHFLVEAVDVHSEVLRRVSQSIQAGNG